MVGAGSVLCSSGFDQVQGAVLFAVVIVMGELLRVMMPGGREMAPVSAAATLGYALLLGTGPQPAGHSVFQVVVVTGAATLIGSVLSMVKGRPVRWHSVAVRLLSVALVAVLFRPVAQSIAEEGLGVVLACKFRRLMAGVSGAFWQGLGLLSWRYG